MPRAIWTGSISFGLVNVPCRLYSAVAEHRLHFHLVHRADDGPIGYQKVCKLEDRPVRNDEIVKVFEFEEGDFVVMEEEDFAAARVEGYRTIEITDFVPYADIDPIFFAHTYYVGPQEGSERVYSLLVRAMESSGLAGVAKYVMRDRQHLGVLRIRDGVITLEQLHFADEIRPVDELRPEVSEVDARELAMAAQLIEGFTADWEPERYADTYREALCAVIRAKRAGEDVHRRPEAEGEEAPDLLAALRASVEAVRRGRAGAPDSSSRDGSPAGGEALAGLTKTELQQRARDAGIEGRSRMTKEELVEALSEAA